MAHTIITLATADGQEVKCEKSTIEMSSTVKDLLSTPDSSIPIQNVTGNTLAKIIEWVTYHNEHPDPPVCDADKYRTDNISDWDTSFMHADIDMLIELAQAANYLDIRGLSELCRKTFANMIKVSTPDSSIPIPIQNVKGNTLAKIIEWVTYHKEHPDPPVCDADKYRIDNISDWDTAFMNVDMGMLVNLAQAANYLDIRGLLELCCKTIANMIKGSTPEEVKEKIKLRAAAN